MSPAPPQGRQRRRGGATSSRSDTCGIFVGHPRPELGQGRPPRARDREISILIPPPAQGAVPPLIPPAAYPPPLPRLPAAGSVGRSSGGGAGRSVGGNGARGEQTTLRRRSKGTPGTAGEGGN